MKISFNWLKTLVALPDEVSPHEVADRLSRAGLEVESVSPRGQQVKGVRVAEVLALRPHPHAEKLRIVRLTVSPRGHAARTPGEGAPATAATALGFEDDADAVDVVCGAPNVPDPGGRVAWAPPGATLPGGVTLGRKQIRGVESPGMICSERELGIGEDADGILVLPPELPPGAELDVALHLADHVLEVNVTPNRSDALSHAGIAREVAALFGTTWKLPLPAAPPASAGIETPFPVQILDAEACARYQATVIRGLHVGPSPLWMRLRLAACGVRSISNLVDVTNYVMLETGHPLHVFDLAKLSAPIVIRRAAPGEGLRTLDGVERALDPGDIVVADKHGAIALAGVMGGGNSEVVAGTTDVLLEAATFDPRSIRRTSKRLGLHSEASHRFERGVDAASVARAGARAADLLAELGGGAVAATFTDVFARPAVVRRVTLPLRKLQRIAGFDIPVPEVIAVLGSLGMVSSVVDDGVTATIPSFRPDVTIEEDLVEEVMRMVGLDKVPPRLPTAGPAPSPHPEAMADRARDALAALGLHEIAGWAFVSRGALASVERPNSSGRRGIVVKNPISADHEVMRTSLLPGLAEAAARNLARGRSDVRLFEVGPVIFALPEDPERHHDERNLVAGLMLGRRAGWLKPGEELDFFDLKFVVTELLRGLGLPSERLNFVSRPGGAGAAIPDGAALRATDCEAAVLHLFHPGISAAVQLGRPPGDGARRPPEGGPVDGEGDGATTVGGLGQLHPTLARRLGLGPVAFYFELELDPLQAASDQVRARPVPRFPAATRDVSFWIDADVSAADQERTMRIPAEPLLREIAVREDFRDPRWVKPGRKGMLFSLTYRANDRTLTDAEVDGAHARIVAALERAHAIERR